MDKQTMVAEIRLLAPKLTETDVEALLGLESADLRTVLDDYKLADKLNDSDIDRIYAFLKDLKPLADFIVGIVKLFS